MFLLNRKVVTRLTVTGILFFSLFLNTVRAEETVSYYLYDHLGGIDKVLDDQGNVIADKDYLPFGMDRLQAQEAFPELYGENYGFTGKELDEETGLYYYGARYYDPLLGRFISADPWEGDLLNPQTLNKYSYAINNPLKFVDPTGMYIMESGEVEKGDTLSGITSELNDYFGTSYSFNDVAAFNSISDPNKISIGDSVLMGAYNNDGSSWLRSYDASEVTIGYWNNLGWNQRKITHYGRNLFQGGLPVHEIFAIASNNWDNLGTACCHNFGIGTYGNQDYRGKGGRSGQQAIYDPQGNLITSEENKGTYDFASPENSAISHYKIDVEPWLRWGNSPADNTTANERLSAFRKSTEGKAALLYDKFFNSNNN